MRERIDSIPNNFFRTAIFLALILILPSSLAYGFYKAIPIQNFQAVSIVSGTGTVNLIIWTWAILQLGLNYIFIRRNKQKKLVSLNLFSILILVMTIKILTKAIALKGTPLPSSDIRGDLLNIVNWAQQAEISYWSGNMYPPIWPTILGNTARLLDVHVLDVVKPAEFILMVISPALILFVWRLFLDSWMALVITINQALIYDFDYKKIVLNLLIPLVIYIALRLKSLTSTGIKLQTEFFLYGLFLGFLTLLYSSYLYWLVPLLASLILISFFSKSRLLYFELKSFLYLGLAFTMGPLAYSRIGISYEIYNLTLILILILLISTWKLNKVKGYLFTFFISGVLLALVAAFIGLREKDVWVEGGIEKNNPTIGAIMSLRESSLVFLALFLVALFYLIKVKKFVLIFSILGGAYVSSIIFMYLILSQMQVTQRVDLWPRAGEVQGYSLNLLFLLMFLFLIDYIKNIPKIEEAFSQKQNNALLFSATLIVLLTSYVALTLGSAFYSSMPYHSFTGAWYAHQGCSNPHEDPMLSKVFENNPDIQTFLRENCSSANWPEIPKIVQ